MIHQVPRAMAEGGDQNRRCKEQSKAVFGPSGECGEAWCQVSPEREEGAWNTNEGLGSCKVSVRVWWREESRSGLGAGGAMPPSQVPTKVSTRLRK
jgi:hypothetical protein